MAGNYAEQGDARAAERARRRAQQRRRLRRQRRLFAAGTLCLVAVLVAVVALCLRDGETVSATHDPRHGWRSHTGPVPILEYHVLGRPRTEVAYPELYVPRAAFRGQMAWLARQEYDAVTLEEVEDAWYRGGTLPPKPMVISFDDGYRPQFTFALPQLRERGWPGVLNLKAEGSDLYSSDVEAMLDTGWELAAHTIDHSDLTTVDPGTLRREVAGSRRILRREFGVPVANFCYPAGRFDPEVIAAVEAAGYAGATTEIPGFATRESPYELARIEVLGSWRVADLAAAMRPGAAAARS
jgi:peptidoglycan/xylan/chitin deacetylase (PgdA/CDA1 family)